MDLCQDIRSIIASFLEQKDLRLIKSDDISGHIKCDYFAKRGHLNLLQFTIARGCIFSPTIWRMAAFNGHLEIIQWARANGYDDNWICDRAAEGGHLHILIWAQENKYGSTDCVCSSAARGGQLHILIWARANNFKWGIYTFISAALNNHTHILQWALANGCNWDITARYLAFNYEYDAMKLALTNGCPYDDNITGRLIAIGRQDIIEWLQENGYIK